MLYPCRIDWPANITAGDEYTFVVEDTALANANAIYEPVLRVYNFGTETLDLTITHKLDLGTGDDPLHNGIFEMDVVVTIIPTGTYVDFTFGGLHLATDTVLAVTHTVEVANASGSTQLMHAVLYGKAELEAQLPASAAIIRNA
ncbi:MAG: hypothetical protein WC505_06910 [Patescibacteria group bacterium]